MTRSVHKREKPKFTPEKIRVNGVTQTVLAKKARVPNAVVALFKKKGEKLTEEDVKVLQKEKDVQAGSD